MAVGETSIYENVASALTDGALALRLRRIVSTPRHFSAAERNALITEAAHRLGEPENPLIEDLADIAVAEIRQALQEED